MGWVGLGWVGLGWVGSGRVGLGWVGLGWVGLGWVGLGWVGLLVRLGYIMLEKIRFLQISASESRQKKDGVRGCKVAPKTVIQNKNLT